MARTSTSRTRTGKTQPAQTPETVTSFDSIGALFDGKTEGEHQLKLEPEFLTMLGMEVDEHASYTLVIKNRESKGGHAYRSVFLATEMPNPQAG